MIVQNGNSNTSQTGGVNISNVTTGTLHTLEFNTIADNEGADDVFTGIACNAVTPAIVFSSNIVRGNTVSGTGDQVGGDSSCTSVFSDIGATDLTFADADYHLPAASPLQGTADPSATIRVDIDGDPRPAGTGFDPGADEI